MMSSRKSYSRGSDRAVVMQVCELPPKLVQLFWDYRVDGVGEDLLAL